MKCPFRFGGIAPSMSLSGVHAGIFMEKASTASKAMVVASVGALTQTVGYWFTLAAVSPFAESSPPEGCRLMHQACYIPGCSPVSRRVSYGSLDTL